MSEVHPNILYKLVCSRRLLDVCRQMCDLNANVIGQRMMMVAVGSAVGRLRFRA